MVRRVLLSLMVTSLAGCGSSKQAPTPPAPAADASVAPPPVASSSGSAAPTAKPPEKRTLATYLKSVMPKGGSLDGEKVMHTVEPGETAAKIAANYLELTEIYFVGDLERAITKKYPSLVAGSKIEIPSPLTAAHMPKEDPKDEKLGWPEDKALRGIFMTGPATTQKWTEVLDKLQARNLNAVVLDAKDYQGPVTYPTKAKIALEIKAAEKPSIPNLARAIRFAHWRGVRIILRIPCFHDPYADKRVKDGRLSLKHPSMGTPVHLDWLDPTNKEAQDYAIDIAKEGIEAGADEIQLDYVRFPVHIGDGAAKLPDKHTRTEIIRDFVRRVKAETAPAGVKLSMDLFGVAATGSRDDIDRLGQDIAVMGIEGDAISPMVYPSHYDKGYNGWESPGDHPEIVGIGTKAAVKMIKNANGTTVVRSWIQAFPWRTNIFSSKYVVDQATSAEKNGGAGWLMWSPSCEYGVVWSGFPVVNKDATKDEKK